METVTLLADRLSLYDQHLLAAHLAQNLNRTPSRSSRAIEGLWKDAVPPDFDVDAALREIRSEWLKEWGERNE